MLSLQCYRRAHSGCELWPLCSCDCHPENAGIDELDKAGLKKLYWKYYEKLYFRQYRQRHPRGERRKKLAKTRRPVKRLS